MNRVALIKLNPNEEIYASLERACLAAGIRHGVVLASSGSLNDAWFHGAGAGHAVEEPWCVSGPGLEVAGLTGEIHAEADSVETVLTAWVTRADTSVAGGRLVRGRNIVCITYELIVAEWECEVPES